jgi:hypothetical protein
LGSLSCLGTRRAAQLERSEQFFFDELAGKSAQKIAAVLNERKIARA